jgi:hypothetical protein
VEEKMKTKEFSVVACVLLLFVMSGKAITKSGAEVTLTGQVVCSNCWFEEEDRKAKPYGSEDDIKCAIRCAKRNVPQALAVVGEKQTTLYILEPGKAKTDLLKLIGKQVTVTGTIREDGDKKYLRVVSLMPVAMPTGK